MMPRTQPNGAEIIEPERPICHFNRSNTLAFDSARPYRRDQPKPVRATSEGINGYLMPAIFWTIRTTWQL